jgi:hypothetical protein
MPALMLMRTNLLNRASSSSPSLGGRSSVPALAALLGPSLVAGCASLPAAVPVLEPRLVAQPPAPAYHRAGGTSAEAEADARSCHEVAQQLVLGESPLALEPTHGQAIQLDDLAHQCMERRGYARGVQLAAAGAGAAVAETAAPAAAVETAVSTGEEEVGDDDDDE